MSKLSSDALAAQVNQAIPERMRALVLQGRGFQDVAVREAPVPSPGPEQLLGRVEAAGICTSLIKLIEQGSEHRQIYGWDTVKYPLILGDEGVITVVKVGNRLAGRYKVGQRFITQPAVDHPPVNHLERYPDQGRGIEKVAVGYTLPGHLAEYILIPEEVIRAQCLLPDPSVPLPHSHASMAEPFSCVISAQDHHVHLSKRGPLSEREATKGLKKGGVTVIVGAGAMGRMHVDLAMSYRPRAIIVSDFLEARLNLVRKHFAERARELEIELIVVDAGAQDIRSIVDRVTRRSGADDVIVAVGSRRAIEEAQALAGRGGNLNLFGGLKSGEDIVDLDTGLVHYKELIVTGSSGGSPWDIQKTLDLMARGEINAEKHITRIGDLEHAPLFLEMIKNRELDGKAVVYPHRRVQEVLTVEKWSGEDENSFLSEAGGA